MRRQLLATRLRNALIVACVVASSLRANDNETAAPTGNRVLRTYPVKVSQGVAVDAEFFYGISNTRVQKFGKASGKLIASWQADTGKAAYRHFKHLNSGTVIGDKLYCAHSRYPVDPNANTVEIWDVTGDMLVHLRTIEMPRQHGSLTWIDRRPDDSWWMCYAVYGKDKNQQTTLVRYDRRDGQFVERDTLRFPAEVVAKWGRWSCSGGSWGPDGLLYVTGHDHARVDVLAIDTANQLTYLRTETHVGLYGQAIAWDRSTTADPTLWGIVRNRSIAATNVRAATPGE